MRADHFLALSGRRFVVGDYDEAVATFAQSTAPPSELYPIDVDVIVRGLSSTFVGLKPVTPPSALVHLSHPPIMNIIYGYEYYVLHRARFYVGDQTECFLAQIKKGGG